MKFKFLFTFAILLLFLACKSQNNNNKTMDTNDTSTKIEVIDFYGTHRCITCKAIEANTKYTIDNFFQEAVEKGTLEFKTINVDEKKNYDMAERFETTGTALFINVIKNGKEQHIDLTNFAFAEGKNKEIFSKKLKEKINEQLKTL